MSAPRLTDWEATADAAKVVAIIGDSTGELDSGGTVPPYPDLIRQNITQRWGVTGLGLRPTWRDEWAFTGGGSAWTKAALTDVWDVGPMRGDNSFVGIMLGNGSAEVATWTKPAGTPAATSFALYMVDGPTSGQFSYRIDGGTWTNVTNTWAQDNSLDRVTIATAVTSTVEVRAANAAGTAVNTYLCGLEPISGTGCALHDLTASSEYLVSAVRTTSGDWGKWIDLIQPQLVVVCYTNDLQFGVWNATNHQTQIEALATRVAPEGAVVPMLFWGQDRGADEANRVAQQTVYTAVAAATGVPFIDLFAEYGDYATVNAAGFMADAYHPSDLGSITIAHKLWPLLARGDGNARVRVA